MNGEANNPQRTRAADGDGRAGASCDDARQRAESMRTVDAPSTVGTATLDAWSARVLRCLAPDRRSVIGNALVAAFIALAAVGHSAIVRLEADAATLDPKASLIPLFICAFAIAYLGCAAVTAVLDRVPYRLARRQNAQPAQRGSEPSANAYRGSEQSASARFARLLRGRRLWAWAFAVLFAVFAISLLKNYPGCQTADSWDTIKQALGTAELSNWMPFFYTCLVSPFVWFGEAIGDMNKGFFLFTLVQIAFAAAVLSYTCYWLRERRAPKLVVGAVFCLYALDPVLARIVLEMWKDVPFSLCMLLFVLALADLGLGLSRTRGTWARAAVLAVLLGLLRSNGVYAVAFGCVVAFVALRDRTLRRRLVAGGACCVAAVLVATSVVYPALGVGSTPFREAVGVPLQQLSLVVVAGGDLTDEQADELSQITPLEDIVENYDPRTPDGLKFSGRFDDEWLEANRGAFLKLWFDVGRENPVVYAAAWALTTEGYWCADESDWATTNAGYYGDGRNLLEEQTGASSLVASDQGDYEDIRTMLLFRPLYDLGLWVYVLLFACARAWARRAPAVLVVAAPLVGVWLTLLIAAPDYCQLRYLLSLKMALPVVAALLPTLAPAPALPSFSPPPSSADKDD